METVASVRKAGRRKSVSNGIVNLFFGFGFFLLFLLPESAIASPLSLVLFCIYILTMLKQDSCFVLKYIYHFYFCSVYIVGVAACEFSDIYLSELRTYSGFVGSLPLAVLTQWIYLVALSAFDSVSSISKANGETISLSERSRHIMSAVIVFGTVVESILLLRVAAHPAFLVGLDRFAYTDVYLGGIWSSCQAVLFYVLPVAALYMMNFSKKLPMAFFVVYALYSFWTGNKFGTFFVAAYCVLLVFYPKLSELIRAGSDRVINYIVAGAFALLMVTVSSQALVNGQSLNEVGDYFSSRCAQQGQLWWKMYENQENSGLHISEFESELAEYPSYLTGSSASYNVGIYKAMQIVNPIDFWGKVNSGSRYTEAGYAMAMYYFGTPGAIFHAIIFGLSIAIVINWFIYAASRNWIIESVILFRLFQKLCIGKSMFLFDDLFSPETIVLLALLVIALIVRRHRLKNIRVRHCASSAAAGDVVVRSNRSCY